MTYDIKFSCEGGKMFQYPAFLQSQAFLHISPRLIKRVIDDNLNKPGTKQFRLIFDNQVSTDLQQDTELGPFIKGVKEKSSVNF